MRRRVRRPASAPFSETDLAPPVTTFLSQLGWTVRSEVHDCDIAAVRGEELLVVELKRSVTLTLLVQAVRRQRLTDTVYIAIPRPASTWRWRAENRGLLHLLRRLELGLLFVAREPRAPPVDVVLRPAPLTRRRRAAARRAVLEEIGRRSDDYNLGGSTRRKLMTAYRESAVRIACYLEQRGSLSARELRALGTGPTTLQVLYRNVYGWFEREGRGVYRLAAAGRQELRGYPELRRRFLAELAAPRTSRSRARAVSSSPRRNV